MQSNLALKESFDRNGYVHIPGFLSPTELADVLSNLDRYKREVAPPTLPANRVLYDRLGEEQLLKQLVDMQDADSFFASWLKSERNGSLASDLLGEKATQTLEYFEKAPRRGTPTPPHQDGYYFCLKPSKALTIWVAIDDCDDDNGCLYYVRGSHREGIINHESSSVTGFSQGLPAEHRSRREAVAMHVAAGDCLIHDSATIHYAGPNRSDRWRRSFGLVFYAANARRDEDAWNQYLASVERQRLQAAVAR